MKNKFRTGIMLICLITILMPQTVFAGELGISTYTQGYQGSSYYAALKSVALTGNQRTDIVNVALSQSGYQEGNDESQTDGSIKGNRDFTEYGNWYGMQTGWCGIFISWCANQANVPSDVIRKSGLASPDSSGLGYEWIAYSSNTEVKQGDIVCINNGSHVGLVWKVDSEFIYTVDGNMSDRVRSDVMYTKADGKSTWTGYNGVVTQVCSPKYNYSSAGSETPAVPEIPQVPEENITASKPTILHTTTYSADALIQWSKIANADGYEVFAKSDLKAKFVKTAVINNPKTDTYADKKTTPGTKYYYKVRAFKNINGKKFYGYMSNYKAVKVIKTASDKKAYGQLKKSLDNENFVVDEVYLARKLRYANDRNIIFNVTFDKGLPTEKQAEFSYNFFTKVGQWNDVGIKLKQFKYITLLDKKDY